MAKSVSKTVYTKKRNTEIVLPGTTTTIYQSNRVTNGRYGGFTLIQGKIFVCIMKQLQAAIQTGMDGKDWKQLELFRNTDKDMIKIGIPLSEIGKNSQYKEIYEAADEMMSLRIKINPPDGYESIATLIAQADVPKIINGKSILYLHMVKSVAEQLIIIDKNAQSGTPIQYTKYLYEVALAARSKYTYKLYWIISSWKEKGGFRVSYEKLREQLGISTEVDEMGKYIYYPEYADFKRRILKPIQNDLEKKADCWFNCSDADFEEREGKKVQWLNFKVITPNIEVVKNEKIDNFRNILKTHMSFNDEQFNQIRHLFSGKYDVNLVGTKILDLIAYVKENQKTINVPQLYIIKALLKTFE
jgi:plasmid replication initiation protein